MSSGHHPRNLIKYVVNFVANAERSYMSRRTEVVKPSKQGMVIKRIREERGLSMRTLGEKIGVSDSYISQIENGRANPPSGETLTKLLNALDVKKKYFDEMCREFETTQTDEEYLSWAIKKLAPSDLSFFRQLVELRLSTKDGIK